MSKKQRLTRDDWIKTAFRMLASGGPGAIRVDHLCQDLKVTKGSFYWHFKDLAAFKSAMVSHWRKTAPQDLIQTATARELAPRDLIIGLFDATIASDTDHHGAAVTGAAIRHWAYADKSISRELADADNERLAFMTTQLRAAGLTGTEARSRAAFLCAALIGMELLASEPAQTPTHISGFVDAVLGTKPEAGS